MKTILITIAFSLATILASAQLKGSGKTVTKNYDYSNFDKLNFIGFNDDITIQIGKEFSVQIIMKESSEKNIELVYNEKEYELTLKTKPKTGKEIYDERDTYQIKITMPEAAVIKNFGNSDITIHNIIGRYLRLETKGNGSIHCNGSIDELDVEKVGNGDIITKKLTAKSAKISSTGNGDVIVNVSDKIKAQNTGNGNVQNIGNAKYSSDSKSIGNGTLIAN